MANYICTWIYLDSPEEQSEYPQVGKASHTEAFQLIYWRCVAVFFALSTEHNPQSRHLLFTNKRPEDFPRIDGFDLRAFLQEKKVDVVTLPLRWQTPPGYFGRWRNQFYIFDILEFFENHFDTTKTDDKLEPAFVVLDSDCLINRPLDALFESIHRHGLLALTMPYAPDADINGISRQGMRAVYAGLDGGQDPGFDPAYFGGEIFAATLPAVRKINALAPSVWHQMLERFRMGLPKFNEEAHLLSYCYYKTGGLGALEPFIKRMWTAPHYNNVQAPDQNLPIWHLPSEKTGGIALLFRQFVASGATFRGLTPEKLGQYVGVPKRTKWLNIKQYLRYSAVFKLLKRLPF